jgi:hypothetical protein
LINQQDVRLTLSAPGSGRCDVQMKKIVLSLHVSDNVGEIRFDADPPFNINGNQFHVEFFI